MAEFAARHTTQDSFDIYSECLTQADEERRDISDNPHGDWVADDLEYLAGLARDEIVVDAATGRVILNSDVDL